MNTRRCPIEPAALLAPARATAYSHVPWRKMHEAEEAARLWALRYEAPFWPPLDGKGDGKRDNHPIEN